MAWPQNLVSAIEVVIAMRLAGAAGDAVAINAVQHYYCSSPTVTPPPLAAFLVALRVNLVGAWSGWMPNACTCDYVSARWINDGTSAPVLDPTPSDYSGTAGTGDFQPAEVSAFLEKQSPWRYRGGRPGIHLGPVLESLTTDFRLTSGGVTAAGVVATGFHATVGPGTGLADPYSPCVFSFKFSQPDPITRAVIPMGAPVTSIRVRKTLGRMIRRSVRGIY